MRLAFVKDRAQVGDDEEGGGVEAGQNRAAGALSQQAGGRVVFQDAAQAIYFLNNFAPEESICHPLDGHEAAVGSDELVDDGLLVGPVHPGDDLRVGPGGTDRLHLHAWPGGMELLMSLT